MFKALKRLLILGGVVAIATAGGVSQADAQNWTVELTAKQARQLGKLQGERGHKAIAISPDGAWGTAYGKNSAEVAADMALGYCQQYLKRGKRGCLVYAVDGKVVLPAVVQTKVVSAVYKPVNGVAAAKYFGRSAGQFTGNRARALADLQRLEQDPGYRSKLVADRNLEALLTGRSLMSLQRKGFAFWFSATDGEQFMSADSGIIHNYFPDWVATKDGLICVFDNVWSTGKPIGTRCLIVDQISKGMVAYSWAASANKVRKAQLIAGDGRFGAAR